MELARLTADLPGRIVAKLEYLNPGFSKKDRIARQIIDDALASGDLRSGQTVVELTSGNTGTGLAIVCAVRGHPFVAVMSQGNSPERARMMRALGAEVVLVPQAGGSRPGQVTGEDLALVEASAEPRQLEIVDSDAHSSELVIGASHNGHRATRRVVEYTRELIVAFIEEHA